jgi:thiamine transport system substrate-binding protein
MRLLPNTVKPDPDHAGVGRKIMKRIFALFTVALALGLSACTNTTDNSKVTLVAHDSFVMSEELIAEFKETGGIDLAIVKAGDAGEMTGKLVLSKDAPIADVAFGIDNTFASVIESNQVLADDAELVPIDFADICFNVDINYFKENNLVIPNHWKDLTKPEYKDLTVIQNPNLSSTGLGFLVSTFAAFPTEAETMNWWSAFRNNGVKIAAGWEDAYYTDFSGSAGTGDYPVVLSYSSSPADEVDEQGNAKTVALRKDCFRQTEYAGVLRNAKNAPGAEALIKFMLGKSFQEALPGAMYVYPIDKSVALPESWALRAPAATSTIGGDLDISKNRASWLASYNKVFDVAP